MDKLRKLLKPKNRPEEIGQLKGHVQEAILMLAQEKYQYLRKLGEGTFGAVVEVKAPGKKKLAAKIVRPNQTSRGELEVWSQLEHPNVLPLIDTIRKAEFDIFLMPLHQSALREILEDQRFGRSKDGFHQTKVWLQEVLNGLQYLHERDFCHLDLKAENVLVTSESHAVICDFTCLTQSRQHRKHLGLPQFYHPPETCKSRGQVLGVDGIAFDMWALGMLALDMWTSDWFARNLGQSTHWRRNLYPLQFQALQSDFFNALLLTALPGSVVSDPMKEQALNFLQSVLRYDPRDRPATQFLCHHTLFEEQGLDFHPDPMWLQEMNWAEIDESSMDEEPQSESSIQDNNAEKQEEATNDITVKLNSFAESCVGNNKTQTREEIECISATSASNGIPKEMEVKNERSTKPLTVENEQNAEISEFISQPQMHDMESAKEQPTDMKILKDQERMEMTEAKIDAGEGDSNNYASPPTDKASSLKSVSKDEISYINFISSLKCEGFQLIDEKGEKFVVNLITYHLNSPKDSCTGSVNEIERVVNAFFSNINPKDMKIEDKMSIEKIESKNAEEAGITESNTPQQIDTNELGKQQQTGAAGSENCENREMTQGKKCEEEEILEVLQFKSIGSEKQKSTPGTETNENLSKEKEFENLLLSEEESIQPKKKKTSLLRKLCSRISNCGMCFLKNFCCQSRCCKKK